MVGFSTSLTVKVAAALFGLITLCAFQARAEEATQSEGATEGVEAEKTARGNVIDAVVTTAISEGGPTDYRSEIENTVPEVFFYTELEGMDGQTVTHRWKYNDKVMATAKFAVRSGRQKVWSSNKMLPEWTGLWIIEVVDGSGQIIDRGSFSYLEPL